MKIRREEWDCLSGIRLKILFCLQEIELQASEISNAVKMKQNLVFYHLQVLTENGLIEKTQTKKRRVYWKSDSKPKTIFRFKLTPLGIEATKYFPRGD